MTATFFGSVALDYLVPATMLAFDDTDSPDGMCTTYLTTLILEELAEYDLLGPPRLVRLNPNIPWKTRGNAAVALPMGHGHGPSTVCGHLGGRELRYYTVGVPADPQALIDRAARLIEKHACFDCHTTNPGVVASATRPSPGFYWKAVRSVVTLEDAEAELAACGALWRKFKNGRGVIGATAAMAWRPLDRTWEVVTYRDESRIGTPRVIQEESVIAMDKGTSQTFNNYDYESGHIAIAPGSPCPVLYGIRGDSPEELLLASSMIEGEPASRWLLYLSNQGTDDHISQKRIDGLSPGDSVTFEAKVVAEPQTVPGGHVVLRVSDGAAIDAVFYEPSRSLRQIAKALAPGDKVRLFGSVRSFPRSLNVEKLRVIQLAEQSEKSANPRCDCCDKSMGSMGRGKGYRCKKCGVKASPEAATMRSLARKIDVGWYEPPVAARRHLHKPLRRMSRGTSTRYKYAVANQCESCQHLLL